jgi:hypothetical protein
MKKLNPRAVGFETTLTVRCLPMVAERVEEAAAKHLMRPSEYVR